MRTLLSALLVALAALAAAQRTIDLRVKVLDTKGKPMPGVEVGAMWMSQQAGEPPKPAKGFKTDSAGIATGKLALNGPDMALMAYLPERNLGGFVKLAEADSGQERTLRMEPLTEVAVSFEIPNWPGGQANGFFNIYRFMDKGISLCYAKPMEMKNKILLPPGKYMVGMFSFDTASFQKEVTLEPGKSLDLGVQKLEMSGVAKMWGKQAGDLKITDARGLAPTMKLTDFKGKWVLLEFWGYW